MATRFFGVRDFVHAQKKTSPRRYDLVCRHRGGLGARAGGGRTKLRNRRQFETSEGLEGCCFAACLFVVCSCWPFIGSLPWAYRLRLIERIVDIGDLEAGELLAGLSAVWIGWTGARGRNVLDFLHLLSFGLDRFVLEGGRQCFRRFH